MTAAGSMEMALPLPWCRPIRFMVSRILQMPICCARPTNAVLVESAVASMSVILPPLNGVSLRTFQVSKLDEQASFGKSDGLYFALVFPPAALASTLDLVVSPDSMAATRANALAVEPYWNPPEPPYCLSRAQLTLVSPSFL